MIDIITSSLVEAVFAAMAAVGFALISDPPKRLIFFTALLAAAGRGVRYFIITQYGIGLSIATFIAALIIGFLGIFMANKLRCSMEVVSFPALLPMIPGLYAYKTILSIVEYGKTTDLIEKQALIVTMFDNGITTVSIITALAVGVTIPLLIFYEKSFTMTRKKSSFGTPLAIIWAEKRGRAPKQKGRNQFYEIRF